MLHIVSINVFIFIRVLSTKLELWKISLAVSLLQVWQANQLKKVHVFILVLFCYLWQNSASFRVQHASNSVKPCQYQGHIALPFHFSYCCILNWMITASHINCSLFQHLWTSKYLHPNSAYKYGWYTLTNDTQNWHGVFILIIQ